MMTPNEFAEKMHAIADDPKEDLEARHIAGDSLMDEVLRALGYEKGLDIFWNMEKWYS